MGRRLWTTDDKDRRSKVYLDKHRELADQVMAKTKPRSLAHRSAKQIRHETQSELFRRYAEYV